MREQWEVLLAGAALGRLRVPEFRVASSLLTELCIPRLTLASDETDLVSYLTAGVRCEGHTVEFAHAFNPRTSGLIEKFRTPQLADRIAQRENMARRDVVDLLRCCGVDAEQKADPIPWTQSMLIGFELAVRRSARTEVVIVSGGGLDQERFIPHLQKHLSDGLAVIAIQHPVTTRRPPTNGFMLWGGSATYLTNT